MKKSEYGKETTLLWYGLEELDQIQLMPIDSTLSLSRELRKRISEMQRAIERDPSRYDGQLWRYESVHKNGDNLVISVSPTTYSTHCSIRDIPDKPMEFYPNPLGVNSMQETDDGFILLGKKGEEADYQGLVLLGSGFIERDKHHSITDTLVSECNDETEYSSFRLEHKLVAEEGKVLSVIFGSTHDTGIAVYLPIPVTHKDVGLHNNEHDDLICLPNHPQILQELLKTGHYKDIPATDQLLGSLEVYLLQKDLGKIKSRHQHT